MLKNNLKNLCIDIKTKNLSRKRCVIDIRENNKLFIKTKKLINFSSNDYLGLASHPDIKKAFIQGVQKYGIGSSASPIVSGYYQPQKIFEEKFAAFLNRDKAVLFNSGYHANLGVITTFANRHSLIVSDKLCHASIIDGIVLSRAKHYRYPHNNINHLENFLKTLSLANFSNLMMTESVFSTSGKISSVDKLGELAKSHHFTLIIDDAHGIGVLGKHGRGICEHYRLTQQDVPCLITPLGKAFGGMGAIVSGEEAYIDALIQFSRTYFYSTALPPAIAFAGLASLKIIQNETWRLEKLQYNINYFIVHAKIRNLNLLSEDITPIKAFIIPNHKLGLNLKEKLMQSGYLISYIRPPTVPQNTSRIKISLNCLHTENEIIHLLDILAEILCK